LQEGINSRLFPFEDDLDNRVSAVPDKSPQPLAFGNSVDEGSKADTLNYAVDRNGRMQRILLFHHVFRLFVDLRESLQLPAPLPEGHRYEW
jgi:hypothetical protein